MRFRMLLLVLAIGAACLAPSMPAQAAEVWVRPYAATWSGDTSWKDSGILADWNVRFAIPRQYSNGAQFRFATARAARATINSFNQNGIRSWNTATSTIIEITVGFRARVNGTSWAYGPFTPPWVYANEIYMVYYK